ncbi:hypothetical protein Hamer_G007695 [Homarus americanus]|uniref:Uncharacterized protein n=1 Tax=Homarus americanus TaxID=6706 RepID=A0A8J5JSC0_HOMAM|nr:hypothetical protein Hamer_G007695 [Homarus americanus]
MSIGVWAEGVCAAGGRDGWGDVWGRAVTSPALFCNMIRRRGLYRQWGLMCSPERLPPHVELSGMAVSALDELRRICINPEKKNTI